MNLTADVKHRLKEIKVTKEHDFIDCKPATQLLELTYINTHTEAD